MDSSGNTLMAPVSHDQVVELQTDTEETVDLTEMVWFHAKEQFPGRSFMHNLNYNLIRIAVGSDGIYKLESATPKLLNHWKFKEIRDSSYSGFSFTLQFRGGKSDYNVRTDDGEDICSYIEAFQKNPEKALEQSRKNPPMSNIPESGLMTLRRKFSAENKTRPPKEPGVKFYTLNRKSKKTNQDPYSSLRCNVEMDSRLRGRNVGSSQTMPTEDARRSFSLDMRPLSIPAKPSSDDDHHHSSIDIQSSTSSSSSSSCTSPKMNGGVAKSGGTQDKHLAREVLTQRIKAVEEKEKRLSNGVINHTPISTKGEPTNDTSTNSSSTSSSQKRSSSNSPLLQRKPLPLDDMTTFNKAGSAPPTLPLEGEREDLEVMMSVSISKAKGSKHLNMLGIAARPTSSTSRGVASSPGHSPLATSTTNKGLADRSIYDSTSTSSTETIPHRHKEVSPDQSHSSSNRSSTSSHQLYDHLDDLPTHPPSKNGDESQRNTPTDLSATYDDILSFSERRRSGSISRISSSSSSAESGVYDHLPIVASPTPPDNKKQAKSKKQLSHELSKYDPIMLNVAGELSLPRRNISQPALSTPNSARESPCDQFGRFNSIDEESSDDQEEERGQEGVGVATPTNSDEERAKEPTTPENALLEGVTLRQKKKQEMIACDPFAELLSPKSASRLRWSQELNPLYDYIKGFKISDGVKLYDSTHTSKLVQSTTAAGVKEGGANGKPPSMIMEEEGEEDEEEEGSVLSWDQGDTLSMAFSQDTMSLMSQDTQQSPTSPTSSCGGEYGDTVSLLGRSRRPHAYEDIMALKPPPSASVPTSPSPLALLESFKRCESAGTTDRPLSERVKQKQAIKGATVTSTTSNVRI